MTNREEPLTIDEAKQRKIVCSDEDAEQYKRIVGMTKTHEKMREIGEGDLDEGKNEAKKDLSWNATIIDEVGAHIIGPYAIGGRAVIWEAGLSPVDYVASKYPKKSKKSLEKEFAVKGYEKFARKYDASLENRIVGVKKILEKQKAEGLSAKRFIREGRICKKLTIPGTPTAIYADEYNIVFKMFLDRVSLRNKRGRTSREDFEIAIRMVQKFMELYAAGVMHRDINPNNVLTVKPDKDKDFDRTDEERYEIAVVDFGQAKLHGIGELQRENMTFEAITQVGEVEATPSWMSPNVAEHGLIKHTLADDIYAVGATAYTLLTGRVPVSLTDEERDEVANNPAAKAFKLACKILDFGYGKIPNPIIPVHEANFLVPSNSGINELLVDRCMAANPKDRPSSFKQIFRELNKIKKNLSSDSMKESAKDFQIPTYLERTQVIAKAEEDAEKESLNERLNKKESRRVAKFENSPIVVQKKFEPPVTANSFKDQGIEVDEGGTTLQRTVNRVQELGENGIRVQPGEDFFEDINHLIEKGETLEKTGAILKISRDKVDDAPIDKTLIITPEEHRALREEKEKTVKMQLFPLAKRQEYNMIPYTPKKLGFQSTPHTKFHKK